MKAGDLIVFSSVIIATIILVKMGFPYTLWETSQKQPLQNCTIPSQQQITQFCQQKGYESGWTDSLTCKQNQVTCHKSIGDLQQYKCENWE